MSETYTDDVAAQEDEDRQAEKVHAFSLSLSH